MMQCAKCKAQIDNDSFFCDQCGSQIMICPACKEPRKGKRCTQCGAALVSAQDFATGATVATTPQPPTPQPQPQVPVRMVDVDNSSQAVIFKTDAIIGRTTGDYPAVFGSNGYVSGTHARIGGNASAGWSITDLGSTNGTKVNGLPIQPNTPVPLPAGTIVEIGMKKYRVE